MSKLLRPTLGPTGRTVAVAPLVGSRPPEIIDSGGTIARRTIELAGSFENMGAMITRHAVWRVHEKVGDGTATAAVLLQKLMEGATRYLAAGGNPILIKRGMERALCVARSELRRQAREIDLPSEIAAVIASSLRDGKAARMIGEVLDAVGADGAIVVRDAPSGETTCEYIEGVRWNEGFASPYLLDSGGAMATIEYPRIFVTDYVLDQAEHLVPVVEACIAAGERNLLVIAPEIRDAALALLILNRDRGVLQGTLAVKPPYLGEQQARSLEDLALIAGARCFRRACDESFGRVHIDDLGSARQAWATRTMTGILGGRGDRALIRKRISEARAELSETGPKDAEAKIRERIGRLTGAAAVIHVGGRTKNEQAELKLRVEAAIAAGRAALREGVVPGGGRALLTCVQALQGLPLEGDEGVGARILMGALAEPMRAIAANAGLEPNPIVEAARHRVSAETYDVFRRAWVDPWQSGIIDPLAVLTTALEVSVSAAAMAMTTDVLVRRTPSQRPAVPRAGHRREGP